MLDAKNHTQSFPFHTHNTFNITLVIEQIFSTRLLNRSVQAPAGTIVITNPHEVHATDCDHRAGNSFFTLYVSPGVLNQLNNKEQVYFANKVLDDPALFRQLYSFAQRFADKNYNAGNELVPLLRQLVRRHACKFSASKKNILFRKFLEEENAEKFSLENTASEFGLDKYKFLRLFKNETGLTPNNYIILKRIEKSKSLLQTQDDLLSIAIQSGFYDATHLCRHFKKITGVTPAAYRNAMLCNIVL